MNTDKIIIRGEEVHVTDYDAALEQAEMCCSLHEQAQKSESENVIYFRDAHDYWKEVLTQLLNLKKTTKTMNTDKRRS